MARFSPFISRVVNLLFPLTCSLCRSPLNPDNELHVCERCLEKVDFIRAPFCPQCGRPSSPYLCGDCRKNKFSFHRARSVGVYDGVLKELIHLFKYGGKTYLKRPLSLLMGEVLEDDLDMMASDVIVPVPLHWKRLWGRQFNQASLLAQELSRLFRISLSRRNLVNKRATPSQTQLSLAQRKRNVKGAFRVRNKGEFSGKNILLIDDVLTTGATVNECSKALLQAGVDKVFVLTVARVE